MISPRRCARARLRGGRLDNRPSSTGPCAPAVRLAGDEPGAADFYYGEMEMRRNSTATPAWERVILFLYWLLSGYALRASRALLALVTYSPFTFYLSSEGFHSSGAQGATVTVYVDGRRRRPTCLGSGGSPASAGRTSGRA